MNAEILAHDWAATSLGPTASWPISLRSTLSMMLACPTPMFLTWGPELLCFYNDAYRPILGFRAETALGRPFQEVWGSIWSDIEPMVTATLAGGSHAVQDMPLDLSRQGVSEESWWSFSYSPAFDDEGRIAGLFCVTAETTPKVAAERDRNAADERLQLALSSGNSIGAWDWNVVTDRVTADARFALLYGVDPDRAAAGAPVGEFFGNIHGEDRAGVEAAIAEAMRTGEPFAQEYRLRNADGSTRWVSAQGRCVMDAAGRPARFPGVSFDITRRKQADMALKAAKDEREFVLALTTRQRALTDPEAIIQLTAEGLGHWLGVNRVGFYRVSGSDRILFVPSWSDGALPPLAGEFPAHAFGERAQRLRRIGRVLVFCDSRSDPDGGLEAFAAEGVLAGLAYPLMRHGQPEAGIEIGHGAVRVWSAAEIALVTELTEMTWAAVERAEAVLRLQERVGRQGEALIQAASEIREQSAGGSAAETQLRQVQKMEAVGQLTGGIAHDFNNMLAIIIGGLNLTQRRLARGDTEVARYLDGAMEGATRAASLTQRLLAFSRQQPLAPEAVNLNRMVADLTELLTRTLGEQIKLETVLAATTWMAKADPNQLENVVINLAVNARDAMPEGGRLTIETANTHVDDAYAHEAEIRAGQYVMIAVTDTGTGMTPDVLAKAFDPFFTTKEVGKGTGLGLSQVFGFVRQSGGHVKFYSEPGHGTCAKVYLPRFVGEAAPSVLKRVAGPVSAGQPTEIILVVEDEERVRNFSVEALRELGYTVIHAADGPEALALLEGDHDVTLLFTDVVMPGMTGRQLADAATARHPDLKVIYTTGYTRNAVVHNGVIDHGTNFLAKPFGIDQLAAKIRSVLDE